jgi:hypothetical protein
MNEREWADSSNWGDMLNFIRDRGEHRRKPGRRKFRLLACAALRRAWHLLSDRRGRFWVNYAELMADGATALPKPPAVPTKELLFIPGNPGSYADHAGSNAASPNMLSVASVVPQLEVALSLEATIAGRSRPPGDYIQGAGLLREIFGNPFRPVVVGRAWRAWNRGVVQTLAQAAYDERALPEGILDPARLAVLADALEEAGCTEERLLDHLRGLGLHVRGCWAVDLLVGK